MLSGEPVPALGGDGHLVSAQTGALGWHIDDIMITARSAEGDARLAISAKSSVQVTAAGLPADFVRRAWEQWRNPPPMDRNRDTLALATRGSHNEFTEIWTDIRDWCASSDPALPVARIAASAKHTRVFESVRKPKGMTVVATAEEAVALIRHLEVLPFDFQHAASRDELAAVTRCRALLVDGDLEKARNLWRELVQIGAEVRMGRGSITLSEILARVRSFGLRDHPDFRSSQDALTALTEDRRQRVQTALSTGYSLPRADLSERLAAQIQAQPITPVYGESGSGKSALVKAVLDGSFSQWRQVWLGPEELQAALSAQNRAALGLRHPLADVLKATTSAENVLVLDAAERLNADVLNSVRDLFQEIVPVGKANAWRVVVVTQTQSWSDRHQILLGQRTMPVLEVPKLEPTEVRAALWKTPGLSWITAHGEIVDVLTNPRTLAWVVDAAADFGTDGAALSSHIKIVDRLWERWTGGRTDVHNLVVRLAEREADFERSFSRSSLSSDDAAVFDSGLERLPLRLNHRNRIEFEHDLAADWARFQLLKEFADDPSRWAPLASNPLWTPALRLLGQFLLREPSGEEAAWDAALRSVEGGENSLAADMLLDGLCLDPDAEKLLTQRADLLFADRGRRLNRLLNRFHHIATVPSAAYGLLNLDPSLSLCTLRIGSGHRLSDAGRRLRGSSQRTRTELRHWLRRRFRASAKRG